MNAFRPKPMYLPWPPLLYGAAILAAFSLSYLSPLSMPDYPGHLFKVIGATLIVWAICLDIWALSALWKHHTTVLPHRSATRLVTSGPFYYTRNPIYLGYTILTIGLAFVTGNAWFIVLVPVAMAATHAYAVHREERHLLSRFGIEFELYCQKTRRWI